MISEGIFAAADRNLQAWRRSSGFDPDVLKMHYQFFNALERHQECDVDVREVVGLFVEDLNRAIQARQVAITTLIMAMPFATGAVSNSQERKADQVLDEEIQFVSELIDSGHFPDADSYASASSVLISLHRSRFTVNCEQRDRPGATEQLLTPYHSWEKSSWSDAAELIPKRVTLRNSLISIAEMLIDGGRNRSWASI